MDDLFSGLVKSRDPILRSLKGKTEELFSRVAKKADDAMEAVADVGTKNLDEGINIAEKVVKEAGEGENRKIRNKY